MHVVVSSEVSECSRTRIRSEVMPGAFEGPDHPTSPRQKYALTKAGVERIRRVAPL